MNVNGIELKFKIAYVSSGAGRNLKVGAHVRRRAPEKFFFVVQPPLFGSTCTISRSSERFRDGQYILVSFLFDPRYLRALPFVNVRGTCHCAPWF